MTKVYKDNVIESLQVLADYNFQKQALLNPTGPYMWLFIENYLGVFDDTGLLEALNAGQTVFGKKIDQLLYDLRDVMDRIDEKQPDTVIVDMPEMQVVREKAAQVLKLIETSKRPS